MPRLFNTLYSKLALALFGLVAVIGLLFFLLVQYSTEMYQQELNQKLNAALAENIVAEEVLLSDGVINEAALRHVFHMLMVVNPAIEVYLLDHTGRILDYSAPDEKIKRTHVGVAPIEKFITRKGQFPVLGDDPRNLDKQKVFSVVPVKREKSMEGYLYIILRGEEVDSIAARLEGSYIARFTLWGIITSLLAALLAGLLIFFVLTGRIRRLSDLMSSYAGQDKPAQQTARYPVQAVPGDEIDRLGNSFNVMADRIDAQLQALKRNDVQRRELIANVSHDLRTPLATLHGYLETLLLKDREISDAERTRYLEIASSHSNRLNQLVSELFELAKLDSVETLLNIEPFSLGELIQDVVQKFQLLADERGISLQTRFSEGVPFAWGDIGMMQRVLENLLENALRYTPEGGCVKVELNRTEDKIQVSVADTGCGIPKDELEHIFDRFYRLEKSRGAGTDNAGLGLAIVKRIIELHGSQIRAESEPEKGTSFSFWVESWQQTAM
ncbi:MAG: ATP-binding protein [Gammaproteobacteria bacterium]|nr:ATP-binding protein [Gammaproteobacteria bacterium]MDH5651123.1 ATP-binding protein [Gammaproteobacteria bacterium]